MSFDQKLQLQLPPEMLETRIKLIFTAKPADGEPPMQAEAWLYVLPSGKPALVLTLTLTLTLTCSSSWFCFRKAAATSLGSTCK